MTNVISITRRRKRAAPRLKRLPKLSAPLLRLNGLCPYYTMFPLEFPFRALQNAAKGEWVLDPFCGRGTTILAARLRGLSSVGIDSNPVAAAIAASKLARVTPGELTDLAKSILHKPFPGPVPNIPRGEFWERCFAPETLRQICRLRNYLNSRCRTRVEIALRGLMLGILHGPVNRGLPTYLSNQMPRTYATKPQPAIRYWKKNRLKPADIDVQAAIQRRAEFSFAVVPDATLGKIVAGDSRTFDLNDLTPRYSWVITSPPYYGMRTYFPDQWLRNWFVGGPSDVEYLAEDQISHQSEQKFVSDLATVWQHVAFACKPGAKLVCRFGALPSRSKDPLTLFRRTLNEANDCWRITTVRKAGTSQKGRRQSDQFVSGKKEPIEEVDIYATRK